MAISGLHVPGAPTLDIGDELILFGRAFEGRKSFKPLGLSAGVVKVKRSSEKGTPFVEPRGTTEELDQFLADVRARTSQNKK